MIYLNFKKNILTNQNINEQDKQIHLLELDAS